jgi:hypothetical protein
MNTLFSSYFGQKISEENWPKIYLGRDPVPFKNRPWMWWLSWGCAGSVWDVNAQLGM